MEKHSCPDCGILCTIEIEGLKLNGDVKNIYKCPNCGYKESVDEKEKKHDSGNRGGL